MELRHLRYFVTVVDTLNFTKAAAKLRVAQPALSRQIRDLENELGVQLLERNSRMVRVTDAGKAFAVEAGAVLDRAEIAKETARAFASGDRGEIHIGYAPSPTVEILPPLLRAFEKQSPNVRATLHDLSVQGIFQGLRDGKLDAALTVDASTKQMRHLVFEEIRSYPVCVAIKATHKLARQTRVRVRDLRNERLIVYAHAEYPDYREWMMAVFSDQSLDLPTNLEEHDSGSGIMAAVEAGRGVAIVPAILSRIAGPRVKLRPVSPTPEPLRVGVAYRRDRLSAATKQFVKVAIAQKANRRRA